jgi:hypothetical protein
MIFIPFNVASSKNSKRIVRGRLINSKLSFEYKKNTQIYWIKYKNQFLEMIKNEEKPYKIGFKFIRDSRRKSDYSNIVQLPLDLMQEYGWIENDDMTNIQPFFLPFEIDKSKAGVEIYVVKSYILDVE